MLPRLEREETSRLVNAVAYAFGSMAKEDAASYRRSLRADEGPTFVSPAEAASAMGIKVVRKSRAANS